MAITVDVGTALANDTANDATAVNTRFSTLKSSVEDALSFLTEITDGWEVKTTSVAAGAVKTMLELEWDPSDGSNLTDNTSGVGIDFTMPEDDDTQSIYARIAGMVANDAANAWGGILRFSVADDADGSLDPAVDIDIASMRPYTSDKLALGDANQMWADLFLADGGVLNFNNGNVTVTHASGALTNSGTLTNTGLITATAGITSGSAIKSDTDSTDDLGATDVRWANIYTDNIGDTGQDLTVLATTVNLPSGAVFDWDSGDVTLTHASNTLTVAGGTLLFPDSIPITMGTGSDATIQYDGTNLIITPDAVGSGYISLDGDIRTPDGHGITCGHPTQLTIGGSLNEFQVVGTAEADSTIALGTWSANANSAHLKFLKSRNATIGSSAIVSDGDTTMQIVSHVDDGTDYASNVGYLRFQVDGTPGENDTPGRFVVYTTADGAASGTERFKIDNVGDTYTNDGSVSSLSDASSKKDVANFTDGLAVINRLQPIKFKYNGRYGMGPDDGVERLGFSAQAVQGVAPYLVKATTQTVGPPLPPEPDDDQVQETAEVLGMSQTKLIPIMVNAFKEVEARLAALEAA